MRDVPKLPSPQRGPPASYIHVIWLAAFPDDPHEYYDELDAQRWSIRCVRVYRDRSHVAFSHSSPNWPDVMPEAAIDEPDTINRDSQFRARAITQAEFAVAWDAATGLAAPVPEDPFQFNVQAADGAWLCPCCGFPQNCGRPMYDEHGGDTGISICSACFWEPGFDDDPHASEHAQPTIMGSLKAYRQAWTSAGQPWRATTFPAPDGWNPRLQLAALLQRAPHLES